MPDERAEAQFLEERLDAVCDGLRDGIRREVARLHELGLPVYVEKDGQVVVEAPPRRASDSA
jgi:hypothetical protein